MWTQFLKGFIAADKEIGKSAQEHFYYKNSARINNYMAEQVLAEGEAQADMVRRQGTAARSQAIVDIIDSGATTTSGTGALLMGEIIKNSEHDAMVYALAGRKQSLEYRHLARMANLAKKFSLYNAPGNALAAFFGSSGGAIGGAVASNEGQSTSSATAGNG